MPLSQFDNSTCYAVPLSHDCTIWIIENDPLEKLLLNRNLIGLDFTRTCQQCSEIFFGHLTPELNDCHDDLAELLILSKGIFYWLHNAYEKTFTKNLELNLIATKRMNVSASNIAISVPYCDISSKKRNLVIADTIATGSTICAALDHYLKYAELEHVFVLSFAGSIVGTRAIALFCEKKEIKVTFLYGLAAFGLADNGFDLSFLDPHTICNVRYTQKAKGLFGNKPVSAVGWDFGSQAQSVSKYKSLCWIEEQYWNVSQYNCFSEKMKPNSCSDVMREKDAFISRQDIVEKLDFDL